MCSGYYTIMRGGLLSEFAALNRSGRIAHPPEWTDDIDYPQALGS